jgi:hypothetical protein
VGDAGGDPPDGRQPLGLEHLLLQVVLLRSVPILRALLGTPVRISNGDPATLLRWPERVVLIIVPASDGLSATGGRGFSRWRLSRS